MEEYTVAEAAAQLGITVQSLRHRIRRGHMKARRVGARLWVIAADEVERVKAEPPKPGRRKGWKNEHTNEANQVQHEGHSQSGSQE